MTRQPATTVSPVRELQNILPFFGLVALVVGVILAAFQGIITPIVIWIVLLLLILALTLLLSRTFTDRWLGILIDDRNKYSLSRLQMVMWTIVILSAFVAAVLANTQLNLLIYVSGAVNPAQVLVEPPGTVIAGALIDAGVLKNDPQTGTCCVAVDNVDLSQINLSESLKDGQQIYVPVIGQTVSSSVVPTAQDTTNSSATTTPLSVEIPSAVWLLLGISTTSLVASPLIKSQKKGKITKNPTDQQASIADLFRGEETGNSGKLDLAKTQMFYFTLIIVGAYMIAVTSMLLKSQNYITSLPALDGGVIAMLGVSHAGYLSNKAVPHSDSPNNDDSNGDGQPDTGSNDMPLADGSQPVSAPSADNTGGVG